MRMWSVMLVLMFGCRIGFAADGKSKARAPAEASEYTMSWESSSQKGTLICDSTIAMRLSRLRNGQLARDITMATLVNAGYIAIRLKDDSVGSPSRIDIQPGAGCALMTTEIKAK